MPELILEMKRRGHSEQTIRKVVETSCDETAAAVFTDELTILSNVVASQTDLHARFGGVVPEVAARAHLQRLLPVIDEALRKAGITLKEIGCVAVLNSPGLVGSLLIGVSAAKMLALALDVPLISANHIEAHIYACRFAPGRGATSSPASAWWSAAGIRACFIAARRWIFSFWARRLMMRPARRSTRWRASWAWVFRVGRRSSARPGQAIPSAFSFPRAFLHEDRLDFSFSGLKTALAVQGPRPGQDRRRAAADRCDALPTWPPVFRKRSSMCWRPSCARRCGGRDWRGWPWAAAWRPINGSAPPWSSMVREEDAELFIPPLELCTDNAAMAAVAVEKHRQQRWASLDLGRFQLTSSAGREPP